MGRSAYEALGIEKDKAAKMADAFNAMDRKAMVEVADAYDVNIPVLENEEYIRRVQEIIGPWQEELAAEMNAIRFSNNPPPDEDDGAETDAQSAPDGAGEQPA